ncbi:MAG: tRNA pseudouridine(38-40) synthase TruA [Gemmatimonadetes bacterium]|nr:tRNA pseudouridine(38-40) synthase TruA [Gemmatimonadota bacterium]
MSERVIQLVVQYDGTDFSGWQVQPETRTVQGTLEATLSRLAGEPVRVTGAGRTDAGVHARGQSAGVEMASHWTPERLRRALNQQLPADVWIADAHEMVTSFHARFGAVSRRYSYVVGLTDDSWSPFRRRFLLPWPHAGAPDSDALDWCAAQTCGTHVFRGFAVRGTAPPDDNHQCTVASCAWKSAGTELVLSIEANRFLHHMVRFLVGSMMDVAAGKRPREEFAMLLHAETNDEVSPPAAACGLTLEQVTYPEHLYVRT